MAERRKARLILADGTELAGRLFGAPVSVSGEVVFNTGMVGYPETLTDPSYRRQIICLTYPLIGNYGLPHRREADPLDPGFESERIHAAGLLVATLSESHAHWGAEQSLDAWLEREGIPGITGLDTRALTQKLRSDGTVPGKILVEGCDRADEVGSTPFEDIDPLNLVAEVSTHEPRVYGDGAKRVVLVDCGAKWNIVRSLVRRGLSVLRVPWDYDLAQADGDGILVSNGPGNPKRAEATVRHLQTALEGDRPVFGICLGNQLVGLAAGCDTYKLPFGHRGQNQPCIEVGTHRCHITSQNHGYAVDARTLPESWEEWFVNANDRTNEGIRHRERPFWTVQFHPEARPGPEDTAFLFDRFQEMLG